MKKWIEIRKGADFEKIAKQFNISPIVARLIRNRDVIEAKQIDEYITGDKKYLHDSFKMKDIEAAAMLMKQKIENKCKVQIIGDYDIDGINSTYILYKGLNKCGADVSWVIPDRVKDGYGINKELITDAITDGIDTIITCDNGIAAIEAINYGKEQGLTIIVTDHHDIPYQEVDGEKVYLRSNADAIVNPKQNDCNYPCKNLCGASVAWKFIQVLYVKMGYSIEDAYCFIENAGFATVGDVMDLVGENRVIVKEALRMLHSTQNIGMRALIEACGIVPIDITSYHIGFILGPCINASGRLETAIKSLELLLCENETKAKEIAQELRDINERRKMLTDEGVEEAVSYVTQKCMQDTVLVIYLSNCHESLAGIIAGKIRERFYKPTFVLTDTDNDMVKGSGRSIEEYHMYEELNKCSSLLEKYGGHPMAAGLSLKKVNIDAFKNMLNQNSTLTKDDLIEKIRIDACIPMGMITKDLIQQFSILEPFGKGNTKPVLADKNINITDIKLVGKNQNVIKMKCETEKGNKIDCVCFSNSENMLLYIAEKETITPEELIKKGCAEKKYHMIYTPKINSFNGKETIEYIINEIM